MEILRVALRDQVEGHFKLTGLEALTPEELEKHLIPNFNRLRTSVRMPAWESQLTRTRSLVSWDAMDMESGRELCSHSSGLRRLGTASILQDSDRVGKFWRRVGNLGGRPMHRHRSLPTTPPLARVGSCSPPAPPRPQISYTILSLTEWCATRAVVRCELGLLPVVKTAESGARLNW